MLEAHHVFPLGAVIFSIGVIWGGGIVVGSIRTRLETHSEKLKELDEVRDQLTEVRRCVAKVEGVLKVNCNGRH